MGPLGIEYGAKTYIPIIEQSDSGTSKFFSILKFIVSWLVTIPCIFNSCFIDMLLSENSSALNSMNMWTSQSW